MKHTKITIATNRKLLKTMELLSLLLVNLDKYGDKIDRIMRHITTVAAMEVGTVDDLVLAYGERKIGQYAKNKDNRILERLLSLYLLFIKHGYLCRSNERHDSKNLTSLTRNHTIRLVMIIKVLKIENDCYEFISKLEQQYVSDANCFAKNEKCLRLRYIRPSLVILLSTLVGEESLLSDSRFLEYVLTTQGGGKEFIGVVERNPETLNSPVVSHINTILKLQRGIL